MRAVIFANGTIGEPAQVASLINPEDLLIAADGGSLNCLAAGRWPHIVVGDLDSLSQEILVEFKRNKVKFLEHPRDKDQTDLELAIQFAVGQGATEVLFLGLYGERLDQTLANLLLLARDDWKDVRLTLSSGHEQAYLLHSGGSINLTGRPGDVVSLIPFSETVYGVSTHGLRWPLSEADLYFGTTLSISNELISSEASVKILSGKLLVTHRKSGTDE